MRRERTVRGWLAGALAALLLLLLSLPLAAARSSEAVLSVTAARPALLWLSVDGTIGDNVTRAANNNLAVRLEAISDGDLAVDVRTNYDYTLTIESATGVSYITGANTRLEWSALPGRLLPDVPAGETIVVTLQWLDDDGRPQQAPARPAPPSGRR